MTDESRLHGVVSTKDTVAAGAAAPTPKTPEEAAKTAATVAYRDNVTGAVYTDPTRCTNGCTQLVGEEAEKAIKTGTAPAPQTSEPIGVGSKAEVEEDAVKNPDTKAVAPTANKQRKQRTTKKQK